jgi:hypothetical protein
LILLLTAPKYLELQVCATVPSLFVKVWCH